MSNEIKSFGWSVDLLCCEHLDKKIGATTRHFGVNILLPQAGASDAKDWPYEDPKPEFPVDEAIRKLGQLLQPWSWGGQQWQIAGKVDGAWKSLVPLPLVSGIPKIATTQSVKLQRKYWEEIVGHVAKVGQSDVAFEGRTTHCEDAFSVNDERWLGQPNHDRRDGDTAIVQQSLVHALSPTTHTPVALSNDVFRVAGFFEIEVSKLSGAARIAAFPIIVIDDDSYAPTSYEEQSEDVVLARYDRSYDEVRLVFRSHAIEVADSRLEADEDDLAISEGTPARDVLVPLFSATLTPLEIMADSLGKIVFTPPRKDGDGNAVFDNPDWSLITDEKFPQKRWVHALMPALSIGWLRKRNDGSRLHVLHYAASRQDVDDLELLFPDFEACFPELSIANDEASIGRSWERLLALREDLVKRRAQLSSDDGLMLEAFDALCDEVENPEKAGDPLDERKRLQQLPRFIQAWVYVAQQFTGDRRSEAMRSLLTHLVNLEVPKPTAAKIDALGRTLRRVTSLIDSTSSDRLLLGTLDKYDAPTARRALDELLAANEAVAAERAAFDKIEDWAKAQCDAMLAGLTFKPSTVDGSLSSARKAFEDGFRAQGHRRARREFDEPLRVRFDGTEPADTSKLDRQIRGYAIALRSGIKREAGTFYGDGQRAAWVTQTAILSYAEPRPDYLNWEEPDQQGNPVPAEVPGAVGSSSRDGQRAVQFAYSGEPVYASTKGKGRPHASAEDQDEFLSLDFRWNESSRLPLLGFGCAVQGVCTAIDNAGGVVAEKCRGADLAMTCKLDEVADGWWPRESITYLSCVPPGGPRLVERNAYVGAVPEPEFITRADPWELTDQTRAVRFVSQRLKAIAALGLPDDAYQQTIRALVAGGSIPRVACLAPKIAKASGVPLYRADRPAAIEFKIAAPSSTKDFVRSWLATDLLQLRTEVPDKKFSDPDIKTYFPDDATAFEEFIDEITRKIGSKNESVPNIDYHPAVTRIGVELDFGGRFPEQYRIFEVTRLKRNAKTNAVSPSDERFVLRFLADSTVDRPTESASDASNWVLRLPPATFVRIRSYSLVSEKFFSEGDPLQRYFSGIEHRIFHDLADHRAFGPVELWVETLPQWEIPAVRPAGEFLPLKVAKPDSKVFREHTQLVFTPPDTLRADWIRSVFINRHAWHWTGFPVRFPTWDKGEELRSWLPAFSGVESNREQLDFVLPTRLDANFDWRFGDEPDTSLVLHEHQLRLAERPSQYTAYTAKVSVRFSSWLNPAIPPKSGGPMDLEREIFAAGNAIEGIGVFEESKRLAAPAFEHRIPLTASYDFESGASYGGLPLARSVNGNLLIFKDAIRRTDSLSYAGGLGDTIEIDLLQTRQVKFSDADPKHEFAQLGPNPIFHRSPVDDTGKLPSDLPLRTLKASEPHGLTYDLVRNAQVAKTAILVRPALKDSKSDLDLSVEQAPREWQLAQVRVRRLILPETQLNAGLTRQATIGNGEAFSLPWRRDGAERVPYDFAVDFGSRKTPARLILTASGAGTDAGDTYEIDLPKGIPGKRQLRLLVSFHKGRWDPQQPAAPLTGTPYWAPQVYVQMRSEDALEWKTFIKGTCYGKKPWTARAGNLILSVSNADSPTAYSVQMSDYTDARWLLFIGRIAGTGRQPPEDYVLKPAMVKGQPGLKLERGFFGGLPQPPASLTAWTNDRVESFVLFVSAPRPDVILGRDDPGFHGLLAFRPVETETEVDGRKVLKPTTEFELMDGSGIQFKPRDLQGATAVLCSFQRITSASEDEKTKIQVSSFTDLINAIFPEDHGLAQPLESLLRPTGNHWGPMRIVAPDEN